MRKKSYPNPVKDFAEKNRISGEFCASRYHLNEPTGS